MTLAAISDGARLAALEDLGILDTETEAPFDRFTRLAADLVGVPVSLISLIDRNRQFFKSQVGLPAPWSDARQTPLSHSFCQHTVASRQPVVITDARKDPRVATNLAIRDLSALAYAGIPLILSDGHAVGTFCAIDTEPRVWTEHEIRILDDLASAVTALLELRRSLAQQSLHDRLTGLPNRSLTVATAEQLTAALTDGELLAMAIGVDDLSAINAAYGTQHGDRVLSLVSRRIARHLGPDDVVGRVEGDVFMVLRPDVDDQLNALELSHHIRESVSVEPVTVRGEQVLVSVTVGLATGAAGSNGSVTLTRAAAAMRLAKSRRERVVMAEDDRGQRVGTQLRIRAGLRGAVGRGEVTVVFQPIVELSTGRTRGFEALARWTHPELGPVPPTDFIPVAEATGEIVAIGEHVLSTACTQLAEWRAQTAESLQVTVNLSPLQLAVPNIAEVIRSILVQTGLPGRALALEITEGVFMAPEVLERRNLEAIRELGVQIALDDFGTGYSALSYLKRFPVDVIKADRSFLDGLGADRRDLAVMRAILAIGAGMDIQVVAEGVETQHQRELLRLSRCPFGQGYLFAHPLPADEIQLGRGSLRSPPTSASV